MKFSIDWPSHFHPDGRKKARLPAGSMHGWLVKWRGTFAGDEKQRAQGLREIREADAIKQYREEKSRQQRGPSLFSSIFGRHKASHSGRSHPSTARRSNARHTSLHQQQRDRVSSAGPAPQRRMSRKVSSHRLVGQVPRQPRRSATAPMITARRSSARTAPASRENARTRPAYPAHRRSTR